MNWPAPTDQDRTQSAARGLLSERIAAERKRQVEQESFDETHDNQYGNIELPSAAACYVMETIQPSPFRSEAPDLWPWDREWWKPKDCPIRNLERAGALIAAEIDRLERAAITEEPDE